MPGSVFEAFRETARERSGHDFLHIPLTAGAACADAPITWRYGAALEVIEELASRYQAAGFHGRVALVLENRADFFLHWLALNRLGISVIPINHELPDAELPYYLEHGQATAVVALPRHVQRLTAIASALANPIPVVASDAPEPPALGGGDHGPPDADSECALLFTSGSTGRPKACILSNDYFLQQGRWYDGLTGYIDLRPGEERLLTPLPLSHMNAMAVSTMAMIRTGGCIVQLDRFHPSTWWRSVRDSGATALHYLGVLPAILLELPERKDDWFGDRIRFGFGAGVNPRHHRRFEERFGFPLIEAWAMTECGAGGAIIANREPRHVGSCCFGAPAAAVDYQIVDEAKRPVVPGTPGELRVRAAGDNPHKGFFSGYLHDAEATAEIWRDGWLNTGDVVREQPDGTLCFVDRRKNVIRRSGENISALEVEAALTDHPAISAIIATAVPDDIRGDEVAICVVVDDDWPANGETARDIQRHAHHRLAYFKAPGYVLFLDALPVTASNKPKRGDIKQLARQRVEADECFDLRAGKGRRPAA